ncbi:MAG: DUF4925 domain-containing protein [Parabacteroides sp.]|nr:DUF4925 domain-containing protein [Parabacteroides sp.]
MKQFYLLALFCAVSLACVFTACDDDDEATWPDGSEISALYENKSTSLPESNKLMLTYSGAELIGKGVYLKAEEKTLVLYNVFPAEKETFIYNVPLTAAADGYTFAGSSTTAAGATFDYAGKVMPGVMALNLTHVVMPENAMAGQWKLNRRNPLQIKWEIEPFEKEEGGTTITIDSETSQAMGDEIGMLLGFMLPMMVGNMDMLPDGNIQATYKGLTDQEWGKSPLNLCKYYVRADKLYLQLDLQMILKAVQSTDATTKAAESGNADNSGNNTSLSMDEIKAIVAKVMEWGQQGIPLTMSGNGTVKLTLDKEQLLPLLPLMPLLSKTLANSDDSMLQLLNAFLEQFIPLFEHTTVFEVTLALDKVAAE